MEYASDIIIGGAMAFTFLKAQGFNTGGSLIDSDRLAIASELLNKAKSKNISIHLPKDVLASIEISETSSWRISDVDGLKNDEIGLDIGPESCIEFEQILADANTILWNGPLGVYEISNYAVGTQFIAKSILKFTEAGTTSIIGGGDTSAAISALNFNNGFTHISTGGGASLELLSGNYLPAFKALDDHG
jgi:phosphoglycerate kinase